MRLAGHLKWPSVAWGLARISSQELSEWWALERMEPWGDEWRQTATICNTIAASRGVDIPVEKFMPIRRPPQTAAQMEAQCRAFVMMQGGKIS